ncbi:DMT family transporter [Neotabrizicola sp. VNH66]|uniref:DMT family transporter n=1 Tax=Neotabrizicola sp. VNH66 TaxID=3400918 RepID=UPI003C0BADE4
MTAHTTDLPPAAPRQGVATANLLCMISMLIWAAGLPAAELIIPLLRSEQLAALRMILAAAALLPMWLALDGPAALARAPWGKGIAVGSLLGFGAWFLVMGQARGGAVTAAVISATMPVVGMALEVVLDGRRVTAALILGLVLALAGGVLGLDFSAGGLSMGFGALLCFGSVLTFTVGSRLTVTAFPALSPIGRTALTISGAAIALTLLSALPVIGGQTALPDFSGWGWREVAALLAFSVGALAVSQYLWIISVERLGIGASSLHINLAPFYVMVIFFLMGGAWNWLPVAAAALVGLGVLIAQGLIPLPFTRKTVP